MFRILKSILFIICVVMVFTAQAFQPKGKGQQHPPVLHATPVSRPTPGPRPAPAPSHRQQPAQPRPVQTRREAPQPTFRQPAQQTRVKPDRQQWSGPRVYAVPTPAPVENNRLLSRQHHNHWQPRYNFYDNQYHFYPYVNIAAQVELSSGYVVVGPDGQNYYYEQGTFYLQDAGQYVAVAPPLGIIVNPIATSARQITVDGQIFWRYKGVFYVQVVQGYQVVGPVQPVGADT